MYQARTITAENMTYSKMAAAAEALRKVGFDVSAHFMDPTFDKQATFVVFMHDTEMPKLRNVIWKYNNGMFVG